VRANLGYLSSGFTSFISLMVDKVIPRLWVLGDHKNKNKNKNLARTKQTNKSDGEILRVERH
jgi:hypothetical protein